MSWLRRIAARLDLILNRAREDADSAEEMEFHLAMAEEFHASRGLAPGEARRRAHLDFGGVDKYREALRDGRRAPFADAAWREIREAGRRVTRAPVISATIIVVLALGIASCTIFFSLGRTLLFNSVPLPEAEDLFSLDVLEDGRYVSATPADFDLWSRRAETVVELAAYAFDAPLVSTGATTVEAFTLRVSPNFQTVLGQRMHLGRALAPGDSAASAAPAAVISYRLWRDLLGADSSVVGRQLQLDSDPVTLVGVVAPGQSFPSPVDLWAVMTPRPEQMGTAPVSLIGRLRGDADRTGIERTLEAIGLARWEGSDAPPPFDAEILPLMGRENPAIPIAFGLFALCVLSILLIGVANAAGLLITRALSRSRELAVRRALGAGRGRLLLHHVSESLLLASLASVLAIALAYLGLEAIRDGVPVALSQQIMAWSELEIDRPVLGFALALGIFAALACSVPMTSRGANPPVAAVRDGGGEARSGGGGVGRRLLAGMVVAETAIAMTLLLTAGLLATSLRTELRQDVGVDLRESVALSWRVPEETGSESSPALRTRRWVDDLRDAGVTNTALASNLPLPEFGFRIFSDFAVDGDAEGDPERRASWRAVSPNYFEIFGIALLRGRGLNESDAGGSPVALVSSRFADLYLGSQPIGAAITAQGQRWIVVGVVADAGEATPAGPPAPTIYVHHDQAPANRGFLVARSTRSGPPPIDTVRDVLKRSDPGVAFSPVRSLTEMSAARHAGERILSISTAFYALVGLLITLTSLYGIVAYFVARRRRQIGIQIALGASPTRVLIQAMRQSLGGGAIGAAIGLLVTSGLAGLLASRLPSIHPPEPLAFTLITISLLGLILVATLLPALGATRIDPMRTLRS